MGPIHSRRGQQNLMAGDGQSPKHCLKRTPFAPPTCPCPSACTRAASPCRGVPCGRPSPCAQKPSSNQRRQHLPRARPLQFPFSSPRHSPPKLIPSLKSPKPPEIPVQTDFSVPKPRPVNSPETRPHSSLRHHNTAFVCQNGYNHRHGWPALASRPVILPSDSFVSSPFDAEARLANGIRSSSRSKTLPGEFP